MAKAQEVKDLAISSLTNAIEDEKKEQWRAEGRSMLFDAKRVRTFFSTSLKSTSKLDPFYVQQSKSLCNHICSCVAHDYQTVMVCKHPFLTYLTYGNQALKYTSWCTKFF